MECLFFYVKLNKISSWASLLPVPFSVLCSFPFPNKAVSPRCIMPIKGLNQVVLPQAKVKLERLKFNAVSAGKDVGSSLFHVLVFYFFSITIFCKSVWWKEDSRSSMHSQVISGSLREQSYSLCH